MKPKVTLILMVMIAIAFCSCSTQNLFHKSSIQKDASTFKNNPDYQYTIRKDDKISLSIWDHDDMSIGSVFGI